MATVIPEQSASWKSLTATVNSEAEFLEIAHDFGNPLEILREALSNSIDAGASWVRIACTVEEIEGARKLVITIEDNGTGMSEEVRSEKFWGLGFSDGKNDPNKIGEKGHGTKIYLRSERIAVRTQDDSGAFESECERPMRALAQGKLHEPRIREIPPYQEHTGTTIKVFDYNQSERSYFVLPMVRDYLYWFTKLGSVERIFEVTRHDNFKIHLKCLDMDSFEELSFGHSFPEENFDIVALFDKHQSNAADLFVKRYIKRGRLEKYPEVTFDIVVSVEGDQAKRNYNPQIRTRSRKETGRYKVGDRYGIWLCKDFIPVDRVNDWISGFGSGSNAFTLLHGFVNCQSLKLTANRGSIANTDPSVIEELKGVVKELLDEINTDLSKKGIYTLFEWQSEERTLAQEKADFDSRTKSIDRRRVGYVGERQLLEPQNEAELFGLFMTTYTLYPDLFELEPLDYNTSRGIDIIARNKTGGAGVESQFWYVELKYMLRMNLNHGFKHLRWIVCWDFDGSVNKDSEFGSVLESDVRTLEVSKDSTGRALYFLNSKTAATKVQVIRLKEFLNEHLGLEFKPRN